MTYPVALSLPEGLDLAVAAGTALLALATWRMARATKRMAEGGEAQLAELKRQSEAAEARVEQEALILRQTGMPRLRIVRPQGEGSGAPPPADVAFDSTTGEWTIRLVNEGAVAATLQQGVVIPADAHGLDLTPEDPGPIEPKAEIVMQANFQADKREFSRLTTELRVVYGGPAGNRELVTATLVGKDNGSRWLIQEVERYKPAA